MAENALTCARRGFLSLAASAPLILGQGVSAAPEHRLGPSQTGWEAARGAFLHADKAMNDYERDFLNLAAEQWDNWRSKYALKEDAVTLDPEGFRAASAIYDPAQDQFDQRVWHRNDALAAMISAPAPDLDAVMYKIEVLIADERWEFEGFDEQMGFLLADLRRLGAN